jgi:uncharacterized YccA/Bax inhibitor family protein
MLNLILIGCFVAFFMAVLDTALELLAVFIGAKVANGLATLLLAGLGAWLTDTSGVKTLIITTVAGAFLGAAFITIVERVSTYRPTVVNPVGRN